MFQIHGKMLLVRKNGMKEENVGRLVFGALVGGAVEVAFSSFIVVVVEGIVEEGIVEVAILEVVTGKVVVVVVMVGTSVVKVAELTVTSVEVSFFSRRLFHFFLRRPPTWSTFSPVFCFSASIVCLPVLCAAMTASLALVAASPTTRATFSADRYR